MFPDQARSTEERPSRPPASLVLVLAATSIVFGCRSGGSQGEPAPDGSAAPTTEVAPGEASSDEPDEAGESEAPVEAKEPEDSEDSESSEDSEDSEDSEPVKPKREADRILDSGMVLRDHEEHGWGIQLLLPVSLGLTAFDLSDVDFSLDSLATIAVVPTAELLFPLGERWTLRPFVGLGVAWQSGSEELVGDSDFFLLGTIGLRISRWQHFAARHWFGITMEGRYDSALGLDGDELDDWGLADVAFELRRDFGAPREGPRFQGGVYAQGFYVWDPISLDVAGIAPVVADNQVEIGVSLGSTEPYKLLGITLPRTFIGVFAGDDLSGLRIRFGRL